MPIGSWIRFRFSLVHDDRGALTPLMLVLFIGVILTTGVALDLARHESERADLQDALDRGVLAAASLSQTIDADTTIGDYLDTRSLSNDALEVAISADTGFNSRRIDASARYRMDTLFLYLAGLPQLDVPASSAAQQTGLDVEISLVLDISGSMAREFTGGTAQKRLDVLKTSAVSFIDTLFGPGSPDTTTVSLVPYAGHVNAGVMFDHFNISRIHNYSSCTEFVGSDFTTTELPDENSRAQVPHFQWFIFEGGPGRRHEAEWGWCPSDDQAIIPFSNDANALKNQIRGFVGHDGTGTPIGAKWGLGLLDPGTRSLTQSLVSAGHVDARFANRPVDFDDQTTQKIMVIMTDGNIRYQQRPLASAYNSVRERETLAEEQLPLDLATLQTEEAQENNETTQTNRFADLCNLAKQNNVVVYTIGFDISEDDPAFEEMEDCASSDGHFYDVDGLDLIAAFELIAASITKLKLVL